MSKPPKSAPVAKVVVKPIVLSDLEVLKKDLETECNGMLWSNRQRTNDIARALYDEVVKLRAEKATLSNELSAAKDTIRELTESVQNVTEKWQQSETRFAKVLAMSSDDTEVDEDDEGREKFPDTDQSTVSEEESVVE